MKYKMLVLDVDGTLLNDEKEISKRTLNTLLKVQQMGVRIMLASGRPTYGLLPLAKKLELGTYNGYILSYNGGQVINASNGEVVSSISLPYRQNPISRRSVSRAPNPIGLMPNSSPARNTASQIVMASCG